jgi:RimJ/RimL family protein N-acetyltransferase
VCATTPGGSCSRPPSNRVCESPLVRETFDAFLREARYIQFLQDSLHRVGDAGKLEYSHLKIITERLELVAATLALAHAELEDRPRFAQLLDARVPVNWPPPLNDTASMSWFLSYLEQNPDGTGWTNWYFVLRRDDQGRRIAIGNGGFKDKPSDDGMVEVGYSIMEAFQGRGYASEAVAGLIQWAFAHPEVIRVAAETYPAMLPSIRVMQKNGMAYVGAGSEADVIRYELRRGDHRQQEESIQDG